MAAKRRVEILNRRIVAELHALPMDMRAKLWEMRMSGRDAIGRAIYVAAGLRRLVILHAFRKKTRKTPERVIRTALSRMKELES